MNPSTIRAMERPDGSVLHLCHFSVPLCKIAQRFSTARYEKKKKNRCNNFLKALPISFCSGWTQKVEPAVNIGKANGRSCIIIGNGRGADRSIKPL